MRIGFVNLSIEPYPPVDAQAISTCVQQTAQALRGKGHDVMIFSRLSSQPDSEPDVLAVPNFVPRSSRIIQKARHLRSRFGGLDWPGQAQYLTGVRRALRRTPEAPDLLVVANDFHAGRMLKRASPACRVVLWLHNEQTTNHRNLKAAFEAVDRVVTVSSYIRSWVLERFPISETDVAVVHNGVNLDQFHPRLQFAAPTPCPRVLFVGRIDAGKGPDVLLAALSSLADQGTRFQVTLAGGHQRFLSDDRAAEAYTEEVMRTLEQLRGTYLGPVRRADLAKVMREHDIVCVPSRANEAFSLVALEAMASGCAVVASDRGGLREACGGAALHVSPDDAPALKAALGSLLRDPLLLASWKERAVAHARERTWMKTAEGVLEAARAR